MKPLLTPVLIECQKLQDRVDLTSFLLIVCVCLLLVLSAVIWAKENPPLDEEDRRGPFDGPDEPPATQ